MVRWRVGGRSGWRPGLAETGAKGPGDGGAFAARVGAMAPSRSVAEGESKTSCSMGLALT